MTNNHMGEVHGQTFDFDSTGGAGGAQRIGDLDGSTGVGGTCSRATGRNHRGRLSALERRGHRRATTDQRRIAYTVANDIGADASGEFDGEYGGEFLVDVEMGYQLAERDTLTIGAQDVFDNTPDRFPNPELNSGAIYPTSSPMGFNGGFWYARLNIDF